MQNVIRKPLSTPELFAADKKVGYVIGGIGLFIAAWFVASLAFLVQYHSTFYHLAK